MYILRPLAFLSLLLLTANVSLAEASTTKEEAIDRQKQLCDNYNKYLDTYISGKGDITFINKLKLGNSNIEIFTT